MSQANETPLLQPRVELPFAHQFEVEILRDSAEQKAIRIPDAGEDVASLTVRFTPAQEAPWIGNFARAFATDELPSGVFGWPDGKTVAVLSAGYGYVVKVHDPTGWVRLQPMPVTDVRIMPEHKLIFFVDFTHIFAYGAEKAEWKSERLSWEGITITQVATNHIFGLGWDAMQDKEVEFVLDVRTGEHTGGARPWAKR